MTEEKTGTAPAAPTWGVATVGAWTWHRREVEDVVSPLLTEPGRPAPVVEQAPPGPGPRLASELARSSTYFSAAMRRIRGRQGRDD